jgi:hypothetical protein
VLLLFLLTLELLAVRSELKFGGGDGGVKGICGNEGDGSSSTTNRRGGRFRGRRVLDNLSLLLLVAEYLLSQGCKIEVTLGERGVERVGSSN